MMTLSVMLADAATPQPGLTDLLRGPFVPMIIVFIGFMYVTSRMQKKKAKEQQEKLNTLKAGDRVLTSSGIIGQVITVKEKSVTLRSADSKLEITKAAVTDIVERSGESSSEA